MFFDSFFRPARNELSNSAPRARGRTERFKQQALEASQADGGSWGKDRELSREIDSSLCQSMNMPHPAV